MTKELTATNNQRKLTEKQASLVSSLFHHPTRQEAALYAGYSEQAASNAVPNALRNPMFLDAIIQYAKDNNLLNVPILSQIEGDIHQIVLKDPTQYPKYKEVFKQTKQIAGILDKDTVPQTTIINIKHIDKVQVALAGIAQKRLEGQL